MIVLKSKIHCIPTIISKPNLEFHSSMNRFYLLLRKPIMMLEDITDWQGEPGLPVTINTITDGSNFYSRSNWFSWRLASVLVVHGYVETVCWQPLWMVKVTIKNTFIWNNRTHSNQFRMHQASSHLFQSNLKLKIFWFEIYSKQAEKSLKVAPEAPL